MKIYIKTYGCQMNERDSEALAGMLVAKGHEIVPDEASADVMVFNTCSVRDQAERKAVGKVSFMKKYNPDNSDEFLNIDSKILLRRTAELLREKGYKIGNIDSTVAAQAPKLNPHIPAMQQVMADVLGIEADCVSVKATTTERLGFEGRKEGITAYATVLISKE